MKQKFLIPIAIIFLALLMVGGGTVAAFYTAQQTLSGQTAAAPTAVTTTSNVIPVSAAVVQSDFGSLADLQNTFEHIYQQVNPSVVNIQVYGSASAQGAGSIDALGSGFVWDAAGHIVTNNHVVEGATRLTVTFSDGETVDAKVVGTDAAADLAVLQVQADASHLQPATLADSAKVQVGQVAIAIGNPFGLSGTMTQGIISGLSRSIAAGGETAQSSSGSYTIPDIIQTDAAINPGNSGGVLVDVAGQVVGVTAAIQSSTNSNAGIGFVIPSNIVARVVPVLIETGKYEHPRLGISGVSLDRDLALQLGLQEDQRGVLVASILPGGPAAQAGLQSSTIKGQQPVGGDVIIAIDGTAVHTFDDLTSYLFSNTQVGQKVTLTILREGQQQTVELTLGVLSS